MFLLTRAFVRAVKAPIFGRSGWAALRAAFGGGSASRCHGEPSAPWGGSTTSAEPSPRSVEPSFASAGGQLQSLEPQHQNLKGVQSGPRSEQKWFQK